VLTNAGAVAVVNPRGANAPRSCIAMRTSAGEKAICAMYKRTSGQERRASARRGSENRASTARIKHCPAVSEPATKSAGRQPAVGLQTASATAMRWIAVIGFAFREHTTGGLRPPLLCRGANVRR
jgi:hypothetical protein